MRERLSRRSELFLPLALLIPAWLGCVELATEVAVAYSQARLCTLCAAEAFRRAAAQEIDPRRVRGAWTAAFLTALPLLCADWILSRDMVGWWRGGPPMSENGMALLAGAALALARLNEEYLRANAQNGSAALSALLRALLLAGGVCCGPVWAAGAAALGWLVSLAVAAALGGAPFARPNVAALKQTPAALVRLLPWMVAAELLLIAGYDGAPWATAGYLLGMALYGCAGTAFRRTEAESVPLRLGLIAPAAALAAISPLLPAPVAALAAQAGIAAFMGMIVYGAFTARGMLATLAAALACVAAWMPARMYEAPAWLAPAAAYAAPALAFGALALLWPDARRMFFVRQARRRPVHSRQMLL